MFTAIKPTRAYSSWSFEFCLVFIKNILYVLEKQLTLLLQVSTLWKLRPEMITGSALSHPIYWWQIGLRFLIWPPPQYSFLQFHLHFQVKTYYPVISNRWFCFFKMWSENSGMDNLPPHPQGKNAKMHNVRPHAKPWNQNLRFKPVPRGFRCKLKCVALEVSSKTLTFNWWIYFVRVGRLFWLSGIIK